MIWRLTMAQAVHCWKPTYILKSQITSSLQELSNLISCGIPREKWEKSMFKGKLQMKSPQ